MSHLIDMWMKRKNNHSRDHKGLLPKELNQSKYGFLNPSLKKSILNNPKEKKKLKLYGFPNLFWKTWILKILQSWNSSFQRLPLHLLPKIFLRSFQSLQLHLSPKLFYHIIHQNLKIFFPYFLHHSTTLQGLCQFWSCPIFQLPSWNPLKLTLTFHTWTLILHILLLSSPFHYPISIFGHAILWSWLILPIGALFKLKKSWILSKKSTKKNVPWWKPGNRHLGSKSKEK